jgi:predicted O-methyltransferase YrrM
MAPELVDAVTMEVNNLDPDAYTAHVAAFVADGRARAAMTWRYADIVTVLAAAAELLQPESYLEVGVRRGRSMSVVARRAAGCAIVGIDLWNVGYAGIDNPGPEHVRSLLNGIGHTGSLELLSGDSHEVLPRLWREQPTLTFDLITVDGDHSHRGAVRDLRDVLPRLRVGGALVFDDISHPSHPYLASVWRNTVASDRRYSTWEYDDVGYGVAVAVRRW